MAQMPQAINIKDLTNLRMAVEKTWGKDAEIEMIWAHGTDKSALTYFLVVNKKDGTGTPYINASAVYAQYGSNTTPGVISNPGGMTVTAGTAVAKSYTAVTACVTANASADP